MKPSSVQPDFWQRCPKPTVGLPVGSMYGDPRKPSESLTRSMEAEFRSGGQFLPPLDDPVQHWMSAGPGQSPAVLIKSGFYAESKVER